MTTTMTKTQTFNTLREALDDANATYEARLAEWETANPETTKTDDKWRECVECGESITRWWLCEDGDPYCAGCFTQTGASCGGCAAEDCVQCNEDGGRPHCDECDAWSMTTAHRHWTEEGQMYCDGCVDRHLDEFVEDDEEEETEEEVRARLKASVAYWEAQLALGESSVEYTK